MVNASPHIEHEARFVGHPVGRPRRVPRQLDLDVLDAVHVLDDGGEIIGLVVLIPEGRTMLLDNVAVSPSAQHRGHGRRLIAFAENTARAAGCDTIRLYTNVLMTENLTIYRRLGFIETHRGDEIGYRRVYMAKRLAPEA